MKFYQDNKRDQSQPFSMDTFKISLSEILSGCVPDIDKFFKSFFTSEHVLQYADGVLPVYTESPFDYTPIAEREIVDYLIDIPIASHILFTLYFTATDQEFKNKIDLRLTEINDSVGPRTGETVEVFNYTS